MLNRASKALFTLSILTIIWTIYAFKDSNKIETIFSFSIAMACAFLGVSMAILNHASNNKKRIKNQFLVGSLVFIGFSFLAKFNYWNGGNISGFLGVFLYCFAYAPIELYLKFLKWKTYTQNAFEIFILSTLDFLGVNLILIGILSHFLNWPEPNSYLIIGSTLLLIGLLLWNYKFKSEVVKRKIAEDTIQKQYDEILQEKLVSENLLLNILPSEIAEELKAKGFAEAKKHENVTVLFSDVINFTQLTEKLLPEELVKEINALFVAFDTIIEKHRLEKIKTIGDSYMCAGGLTASSKSIAIEVVNAALEMQTYVTENKHLFKNPLQIRIGIHTGPVIAGIVGIKKFAYDIWGDTVNIASRMESSGAAGEVNISDKTYQLINKNFTCIYRGELEVKGKGALPMYFVKNKV